MPTHDNSGGVAAPAGPTPHHHHPHHHHASPSPPPDAASGQKVRYPYDHPAIADFHTAPRYFGAPRSGGRIHAAVDLWAEIFRPIRAVADGTVIQAPYYFYLGTNALEVHHPGLGTVRYGEISTVRTVDLHGGEHVKEGQIIAYVGRLDGLSYQMLHFELYAGTASGPLTVVGNPPFQRRHDLINPTHLMERLQRTAFGH